MTASSSSVSPLLIPAKYPITPDSTNTTTNSTSPIGRLVRWLNGTPEGRLTKTVAFGSLSVALTAGAIALMVKGSLFIVGGAVASSTGFGATVGVPAILVGVGMIIAGLVSGYLAGRSGALAVENYQQMKALTQ